MAAFLPEDVRAYVEEGDPGGLPWQVQLQLLQERLLTHAEGLIETWAHDQHNIITQEQRLFQRADEGILSFDNALRGLREHNDDRDWDVAWDAHTQTPEYAEEQRINALVDAAIDEATSPEYLGAQAEQRFYAEQDPTSQWYREDLYHGEMGPDLAQVYQPSGDEESEYSTQGLDEQVMGPMAHLVEAPLEVDTSDPQMGERWEALLDELSQCLDELTLKDEQEQSQKQRMSY